MFVFCKPFHVICFKVSRILSFLKVCIWRYSFKSVYDVVSSEPYLQSWQCPINNGTLKSFVWRIRSPCLKFKKLMIFSFDFSIKVNIIIFDQIKVSRISLWIVCWAGKGRRPWAATISPSMPHISFFLFRSHLPPLFPLLYHHIWLFRAKLLF